MVTPRISAAAVLDGFGLTVFKSWNLRGHKSLDEKARALIAKAVRIVRAHRPGRIVLGVPLREDFRTRVLRAELRAALDRFGTAVSIRRVDDGRRLILGRHRGSAPNALHAAIVRGFFPSLAPHVHRTREAGAYWRHAFDAAAIAIAELVEIAPRSAAGLALPAAFESRALSDAIAASDARMFPALPKPAPAKVETAVPAGAIPAEGRQHPCSPLTSARKPRAISAAPRPTDSIAGRLWEGASKRHPPRRREAARD